MTIIVVGAIALIVFCFGLWMAHRFGSATGAREGHVEGLAEGGRGAFALSLTEARDGVRVRYEVALNDWGPDHGDMRWRWSVWDADRMLVVRNNVHADGRGIEIPFMLGNSPTRPMAEAEALTWLADQQVRAFVITQHAPDVNV